MDVAFSRTAWRKFCRLPAELQNRLRVKLLTYSRDPLRYAVKLTNPRLGQYRFRIGDYRVVFDIEGDTLFVLDVGHRKDIYR